MSWEKSSYTTAGAALLSESLSGGALTGATVALGGSNWVAPRALIIGDGTGASAVPTVSGGAIALRSPITALPQAMPWPVALRRTP